MISRGLIVLLVLAFMSAPLLLPHTGAAQEASATPVAGATPRATPGSPLEWAPCDDVPDTECAWLNVPVDYSQPDGERINLRLARVQAIDSAKRVGVLLLIPGGPGAGVNEMIAGAWGMRSAHHIDEFTQQYDVVTFDPRGIGESNPIRCNPDLLPPVMTPQDQAPSRSASNGRRARRTRVRSNRSGAMSPP